MRSFSILALAAAALAPFVGAAPAPVVDVATAAAAKASVHARIVSVNGAAKENASIHARLVDAGVTKSGSLDAEARATGGVASILVTLKVNLGVQVDALNCMTKGTATSDAITTILKDVVTVVNDAVVALKNLVGAAQSDILCSLDGTTVLAVSVIAQLLADVLILIFDALGFVLSVVSNKNILVNAIASVGLGGCLCDLINAVLALVGDLLVTLTLLVLYLAPTILDLGLGVVGNLLNVC